MDSFGRITDYLRISVTDQCNERCLYCRPKDYSGCSLKSNQLTANNIVRIVQMAASIGFRKFRLTGGEPLVRSDLLDIIKRMSGIPGADHIGLSTNGLQLCKQAQCLRDAGLKTVNISLDALQPDIYQRITGGDLGLVLDGIRAAVAARFEQIKLNCVLLRGINEKEIWPLVLFAGEHGLPLRLIELMPISTTSGWVEKSFMPVTEAMEILRSKDEPIPQPNWRLGHGPAKYYLLKHSGARVGFIGAITNQHHCAQCNKLRLTSDGKLRPCLGDNVEVDIRQALLDEKDDALRILFASALNLKPFHHTFCHRYLPCRPMTAMGG